jgi:hypothetical protein
LSHSAHGPSRERNAQESNLTAEILTFLAAEPERLTRFLDLTGLTPSTLRRAATAATFQQALIDYLRTDERLMTAFAAVQGTHAARLADLDRRFAPAADPEP